MTIALYPDIVRQNDLSPDYGGSDVDDLCTQIHDATKGWGVSSTVVVVNGGRCVSVQCISVKLL